jgi:hypothetical protein
VSGCRDILFTKVDEAALSDVIREKYPNVKFFENRDWYADSIPPVLASIDVALTREVYITIPGENWRPQLEKKERRESYRIANFPAPYGLIRRSGGRLTEDGEPRSVGLGAVHIFHNPPATKAQMSFQRAIWRRFDKIATWRLEPFDQVTLRSLGWEKTDKMLWAGNDAVRWANENKLRSFPANGGFRYRPIR